jgi:uncharacterized membrane protein YdcZ (DUF606 family)
VKLSGLQWLWMGAVGLLFTGLVLDIAGIIAPPDRLWMVAPAVLMVAGWFVMPSMADLRRANRRG